jgi:hypothetical protein
VTILFFMTIYIDLFMICVFILDIIC